MNPRVAPPRTRRSVHSLRIVIISALVSALSRGRRIVLLLTSRLQHPGLSPSLQVHSVSPAVDVDGMIDVANSPGYIR